MKRFLLIPAGLIIWFSGSAQYYYQDIYSTRQTDSDLVRYRDQHIRKMELVSQEPNGEQNTDFHCEKTFSEDYGVSVTTTQSFETGLSVLTVYFTKNGHITRSVDSTASSVSTTLYEYDSLNRITALHFRSRSGKEADIFQLDEDHLYQYDAAGHLVKMIRQENGKTSSTILFKTDPAGRPVEEQESGAQATGRNIYYKYDAAGRLTDVYRYVAARRKMLPDYIFSYDDQGRLSEMMVVSADTDDYNDWKYSYDERGLIVKEACYGKKGVLKGTIQFHYQ